MRVINIPKEELRDDMQLYSTVKKDKKGSSNSNKVQQQSQSISVPSVVLSHSSKSKSVDQPVNHDSSIERKESRTSPESLNGKQTEGDQRIIHSPLGKIYIYICKCMK